MQVWHFLFIKDALAGLWILYSLKTNTLYQHKLDYFPTTVEFCINYLFVQHILFLLVAEMGRSDSGNVNATILDPEILLTSHFDI